MLRLRVEYADPQRGKILWNPHLFCYFSTPTYLDYVLLNSVYTFHFKSSGSQLTQDTRYPPCLPLDFLQMGALFFYILSWILYNWGTLFSFIFVHPIWHSFLFIPCGLIRMGTCFSTGCIFFFKVKLQRGRER